VSVAESDHQAILRKLAEDEQRLTEANERLRALRGENERRRAAHMEALRQAASFGNQASAHQTELTAAEAVRAKSQQRIRQALEQRQALVDELDDQRRLQQELVAAVEERAKRLSTAQAALAERREQHAA